MGRAFRNRRNWTLTQVKSGEEHFFPQRGALGWVASITDLADRSPEGSARAGKLSHQAGNISRGPVLYVCEQ